MGAQGNAYPTNSAFGVDWKLFLGVLIGALLLLCCLCSLWYLKRRDMRYEFLEEAKQEEIEDGPDAAYADFFSEEEPSDASLLLRKPYIEISESVTSSSYSAATSELAGRGKGSTSSYTGETSELGRTDYAESYSS